MSSLGSRVGFALTARKQYKREAGELTSPVFVIGRVISQEVFGFVQVILVTQVAWMSKHLID